MRYLLFLFTLVCSLFGRSQDFEEKWPLTWAGRHYDEAVFFDVNGDELLDVITVEHYDLVWYENLGVDRFSSIRRVFDGIGGAHFEIADLDGNGFDDLVVSSFGNNPWQPQIKRIFWYASSSSGLDLEPRIVIQNAVLTQDIDLADLDGDGDIDIIAVGRTTDRLKCFENDGSGEFTQHSIDTTTDDSFAASLATVSVSDVDQDGHQDIVVCQPYPTTKELQFFYGIGNFEFGDAVVILDMETALFELNDFDGDGDDDLLCVLNENDPYDDDIVIKWNNGGQFSTEYVLEVDIDTYDLNILQLVDFNQDGKEDIIVSTDGLIGWYSGEEIESGTGALISLGFSSNFSERWGYGDFDQDGDIDLVNRQYGWGVSDRVRILKFEDAIYSNPIDLISYVDRPKSVRHGDVTGDSLPDILISCYGAQGPAVMEYGVIGWFENLGGDNYSHLKELNYPTFRTSDAHAFDFDNDGDQDILGSDWADNKIILFENQANQDFGNGMSITDSAWAVNRVELADLNQDGFDDIIAASRAGYDGNGPPRLSWYENDGNGGFQDEHIISSGYRITFIEVEDIDLDGDIDILFSSTSTGDVGIYRNLGNGDFASHEFIEEGPGWTEQLAVGDLDGDSYPDVVVASYLDNALRIYRNINGIEFEFIGQEMEENAVSVELGDLNEDGKLDILSSGYGYSGIKYRKNYGNWVFIVESTFFDSIGSVDIEIFDSDNDGDLDIALAGGNILWVENLYGEGCTDSNACNYDPNAFIDNGSCCYSDCGCLVAGAENYDSNALCDDGSCGFGVTGVVFFDENENGQMDSLEYGLPFQQLASLPDSSFYITNDDGEFFGSVSGSDVYTFMLAENPAFTFFTTPQIRTFSATEDNWNQPILFGISDEEPDFELDVHAFPNQGGMMCNDTLSYDVCVRNLGNRIIDGMISVEIDSLFQDIIESANTDSVVGNTIYLSFDSLYPGHMDCQEFIVLTPSEVNIGDLVTIELSAVGFHEGEEVALGITERVQTITCAFDPNDKQVFPHGWTEAHYVEKNQTLEYLIRFQNTGNAPATHVLIRDTLDSNLDLSSFQLVANSHSVTTAVDAQTREVIFDFSDIMLPDSVHNEPESHGFVSFTIRHELDLSTGTEIHNDAAIYFDNNPPIITNETWTTLFDCELITLTEPVEIEDQCVPIEIELQVQIPLTESYTWTLDGAIVSDSSVVLASVFDPGSKELILTMANPICEVDTSILFEAWALPSVPVITFENGILSVTSQAGINYQWYFNGSPFINGTTDTWEPLVDGNYSIEVWNDYGCESSSEIYVVALDLFTWDESKIILFPNPMTDQAVLTFPNWMQGLSYQIFDMQGRILRSKQSIATIGQILIERDDLNSGTYRLRLYYNKTHFDLGMIIK